MGRGRHGAGWGGLRVGTDAESENGQTDEGWKKYAKVTESAHGFSFGSAISGPYCIALRCPLELRSKRDDSMRGGGGIPVRRKV
jgi:hypothetical protein